MDDGIFTSDVARKNLRENASSLGINPDNVAPESGEHTRYFAKKGCKKCNGRGATEFVLSPQKKKTIRVKAAETKLRGGRRTKIAGPTRPDKFHVLAECEANGLDELWNTQRPEPDSYRPDNTSIMLCRCIRAVTIKM